MKLLPSPEPIDAEFEVVVKQLMDAVKEYIQKRTVKLGLIVDVEV